MADRDAVSACSDYLKDRLARLTDGSARVALVGYPENQNCGAHANCLGARKLLSELGAEVAYEATLAAARSGELTAAIGNGPIFVSGNLSNRARASAFEKLLHLPNSIVVLPQARPHLSQDLATVLSRRPNVTLFGRDNASKTAPLAAEVAPPTGFGLGLQKRPVEPEYDIVWIARTGKTDAGAEATARLLSQSAEKLDLPKFVDGVEMDVVAKRRPPTVMLTDWSALVFRNQEARLNSNALEAAARAQGYLDRALYILSLGRVVTTDRIGAHVMCLLLRVPHVLCDDGSGGNRAFFQQWSHDSGLCRYADDAASAWATARTMAHELKGE